MEISVEKFMTLSILSRCRLLAGKSGIGKIVTSLNVLDKFDAYKWNSEGTLILIHDTVFLADIAASEELIKNLASKQMAGICLLAKDTDRISPLLINRANDLQFAIISVYPSFKYADLIKFFEEHIYCEGIDDVIPKDLIENKANMVFLKGGLREGIKLLSEWTGLSCGIIVEKDLIQSQDGVIPAVVISEYQKMIRTLVGYAEDLHLYDDGDRQWLGYDVVFEGDKLAHILFIKGERPFSRNDYDLIIRAEAAVKNKLLSLEQFENHLQKNKSDFVRQLFEGTIEEYEDALIKGRKFGWSLPKKARVINIQVEDPEKIDYEEVIFALEDCLTALELPKAVVIQYDFDVVILVPEELEPGDEKHVYETLNDLKSKIEYHIGIGENFEFDLLGKSHEQAKHSADVAGKFGLEVCRFENLGLYRLISYPHQQEEIRKFCSDYLGRIIEYEKEYHLDLIATLTEFLKTGCNHNITAENMSVHPNTIRYRIKAIEEAGGIDLKDPEDRFNIALAMKLVNFTGD